MSSENITEVNGTSFQEEVIKSEKPVLVDFWAPWCGPCKMLAPTLEEIAEEKEDSVKVVKVNVDEAQDIAADYQVQAIPTLILFQGGEEQNRQTGVVGKDELEKMVDEMQ